MAQTNGQQSQSSQSNQNPFGSSFGAGGFGSPNQPPTPMGPGGKPMPLTWQQSVQQASAVLSIAKEIAIVIPSYADLDSVACAVTLASSLQKIGKTVMVVSPMPVDPVKLFTGLKREDVPQTLVDGVRQIATTFNQRQLVLTVDFKDGTFSKGNIDKQPDALVLKLMAEGEGKPIEPVNIDTKLIECNPNAVITIGVDAPVNLDKLYHENEALFTKGPIININNNNKNLYGQVNLTDPKASSYCELVTLMLYDLRFVLDKERAQILHLGISKKTDNFDQKNFSANMLEALSICLRYIQAPQPKL